MTTLNIECSKYDHPDFSLNYDPAVPSPDIDWLVSLLVTSVKEGTQYKHEQVINLGSILLRVELSGENVLILKEPDFSGMPIRWTEGVTQSLRMLRLQKDIAESFGLGEIAEYPSLLEFALLGIDVATPLTQFVMVRDNPEDSDSGWFIGRLDTKLDYNDPENLRRASIYEVATICPEVIGFLAMPNETRVERALDWVAVYFQDEKLTPVDESFLRIAETFKWLKLKR